MGNIAKMKIGVFYGSTTGNTERVALKIAAELAPYVSLVRDVADITAEEFASVDVLLLGASTWDIGELQHDWAAALPLLEDADLTGKTIAMFGLGDAFTYSWNYLDCLGELHESLDGRGATFVGLWPTEGYEFDESRALTGDDQFLGLGLDDDNQPELTDTRLYAWLAKVWAELEQLQLVPLRGAA
ncbi:MAG: flavodoxin [Planctomycetota bacterium]